MMGNTFRYVGLIAIVFTVAACGQRPAPPAAAPVVAKDQASIPDRKPGKISVPDLNAFSVNSIDKAMGEADLLPILRYEPGVTGGSGIVIGTDPQAGTMVSRGDVVTVLVAGAPGRTLSEYVDAHRQRYVGLGVDPNGALVVGIYDTSNLAQELEKLNAVANGKPFRVQTCARSWVDLQRLQIELKHRLLPDATRAPFAMMLDVVSCAVRLSIDLPDAEIAELTTQYSGALVIHKGGPRRAG